MSNIIKTLTRDCHFLGKTDASFSNSCPANYMDLEDCPFDKSCKDVTEKDWIHVITEELKTYVKE